MEFIGIRALHKMLKNPNGGRHGKAIHLNVLLPSEKDTVALGHAVQERFIEVCGLWLRTKGYEIVPPIELNQDMLLWRTMCMRHKQGDYRNTEDELRSTKRIANWTLKVKKQIVDQVFVPLEWKE